GVGGGREGSRRGWVVPRPETHDDRATSAARMAFVQVVLEDVDVRLASEVIPYQHEDAGSTGATDHVPLHHGVDVARDDDPVALWIDGAALCAAGGGIGDALDGAVQEAVAHGESRAVLRWTGR